jgi:hypothetical protein
VSEPVFKHLQVLGDDDQWDSLFLNVNAIELIEGPVEMHDEAGCPNAAGETVHTLWVSTLTLSSGRKVRVPVTPGEPSLAHVLGIRIE